MPALTWSGCPNVRDLGGLPARDGAVRPGVLIRAASLAALDDDGMAAYHDHRVGRVIDLRMPHELDREPHPFPDDPAYTHVSWIDAERDRERDPEAERTLADMYVGSLERNSRQVAAVVRAFLTAPPGPVVVHCAAGKDRTGMLVALLLDLVGVPRPVIAEDYARSEAELGILAVLAAHPGTDDARARAEEFARTRPRTILAALDHLDAEHGGTAGYLTGRCGLTSDEVDGVGRRLVSAG